ncbi:MAG: gliding motility-associated C-terminal domain-containing protein [Saprospiraceae bacterium]|nr:MAG: PKD domain-containing protein [Bacteroidetes bacterium OLB9]MCO6463245.1 gliding motility-associated C-terminal domain-containing protein [Saprospiraceae bacterium]
MLNFELRRYIKWYFVTMLLAVFNRSSAQCTFNTAPFGEICSTAHYICGSELNGLTGTLPAKISAEQEWRGLCNKNGSAQNIIWYSFTPCSNKVTLEFTATNCYVFDTLTQKSLGAHPHAGLQVGLFSDCDPDKWLDCSSSPVNPPGMTGTFRVSSDKFEPGRLAYFYIDGYNTSLTSISICDFSVKIIEGIDMTPVEAPDPDKLEKGYITGPSSLSCDMKNTPVLFSLTEPERAVNLNNSCQPPADFNPADSVCYAWTVFPTTGAHFENNIANGKNVNLVFTEEGDYTISATTMFNPYYVGSCANAAAGDIISWNISVLKGDTTILQPEYVCPGNSVTYCGQLITRDTVVVCDEDPCHIRKKRFVFGTSQESDLGTQYICAGSSFNFQGIDYTTPGDYEVVDADNCALVHKFKIETVSVSTTLSSPGTELNCNVIQIPLSGTGSTNNPAGLNYIWQDQNNTILGQGSSITVSKPGEYHLIAEVITPSGVCRDTKSIRITENKRKPQITAFLPIIRCLRPFDAPPVITIQTADPYSNVEWTTPTGQKIQSLNIQVDSLNGALGMPYVLQLIGANGCVLDTSFVLSTNFEKAEIKLTGDDLTCYRPKVTISASTDISIDSIRWNKVSPDQKFFGSHITKTTHDVTEPGVYRVDVMASSSKCWNSESIAIEDKMVYPELTIANPEKWHCNSTSLDIIPIVSTGNNIQYKWGSPDGNILSEVTQSALKAGSPGTYRLVVTNIDNGCARTKSIVIEEEENKPRSIHFRKDDILCYGQNNGTLSIIDVDGGFEPYTFYLNDNVLSNTSITNLPKGKYHLKVLDEYGCEHSEELEIHEPELFDIETEEELSITFNDVKTLTFESNYPDSEIASIVWTDKNGKILGNDFELEFASTESDIISVEVTTINGCTAKAQIRVEIDNNVKVHIPNIFSPNGDGVNDRLVIFKNKIPAEINRIAIYDRLGNMVYAVDGFDFSQETVEWDGTFHGQPVQQGVYVMLIELTDYAGKRQLISQDLTLIR